MKYNINSSFVLPCNLFQLKTTQDGDNLWECIICTRTVPALWSWRFLIPLVPLPRCPKMVNFCHNNNSSVIVNYDSSLKPSTFSGFIVIHPLILLPISLLTQVDPQTTHYFVFNDALIMASISQKETTPLPKRKIVKVTWIHKWLSLSLRHQIDGFCSNLLIWLVKKKDPSRLSATGMPILSAFSCFFN